MPNRYQVRKLSLKIRKSEYSCSSRAWPHRPEMSSAQRLLGDGPGPGLLCLSLCLQWADPSAMFLEKEVGRRKAGPTNVFLLSHDQLLGTWLGAWNKTRKPLIYIIC